MTDREDVKDETHVGAVSLAARIPDFWVDMPEVWFARVNAILAPQKLSDETKFDLILSKLSKETISELTEIILNPPATEKCKTLKTKLLALYEDTNNARIKKLLRDIELGDQKPSQLLRKMKDLAKKNFPDETLRILWEERLPAQVRAVLAVTVTLDLNELAAVADKVLEAARPAQIAAVTQQQPGQAATGNSDVATIMAEIAKLNARFDNLTRARPRSRSMQRRPTNAPRPSPSRRREDWLCFYHYRYRERARRCLQPCAWNKRTSATPTSAPEN